MKVLVCGGRDYNDKAAAWAELDKLHAQYKFTCLIHGQARGADTLAKEWAIARNVFCIGFPAEWDVYGKSAGFVRNRQMVYNEKPDLVVAFPGGNGTAHTVKIATQAGIAVITI